MSKGIAALDFCELLVRNYSDLGLGLGLVTI